MQALKSRWQGRGSKSSQVSASSPDPDKLVVAHFMLGNTYPFTETDWKDTIDLATDTALDGFALNLGPEEWQRDQAHSAFNILEERDRNHGAKFRMFLSLDMNVLPSTSLVETEELLTTVIGLLKREGYLRYRGRRVLSTFGGHDKSLGGIGWIGFLDKLNKELGESVFFLPSFFMPPEEFVKIPYVDGCFAWNNAWPLDDRAIDLSEDEPFLRSDKVYMASVSPLFFTHYGSTGEWAFNKNWIYRSDDLLLPSRFKQLISLPKQTQPEIIQIISWNDHGESHSIAPVLGAQPGSDDWTRGMDHVAFREIVRYFTLLYKDKGDVFYAEQGQGRDEVRVWSWYRLHPACCIASSDRVGKPLHADRARDLLDFMIVTPFKNQEMEMIVYNGGKEHHKLINGQFHIFTLPFVPGTVRFEVKIRGKGIILSGQGRDIESNVETYNFNMWTGSWKATV